MAAFFNAIPWSIVIALCFFLGVAPFTPLPHLFEKIQMLADGKLEQSVDIFDLLFHGSPFLVLLAKLIFQFQRGDRS
jgi:hypothetical protein